MNYYYPGGYTPNMGFNSQQKIDALQQELARLQQLQAQMYPQPNIPQGKSMKQYEGGAYLYVTDYQDVVDYPTPTDGSAVLFLCLDKGLAWSKKFVNGKSSIQTLTIGFLNSYDQKDTSQDAAPQEMPSVSNEDIMTLLTELSDRIAALENRGNTNET